MNLRMKRFLAASCGMAAVLAGTMLTPTTAQAGDRTCNAVEAPVLCGGVTNLSSTAIVAYKSYCGSGPCSNSHQRRLTRGQSTPSGEDWDGAWVPCRAVGYKAIGLGSFPWSGGAGHHKVTDPEQLVVTGVFC